MRSQKILIRPCLYWCLVVDIPGLPPSATAPRRLATYPTFQLGSPLVNNYGVGSTITNFGPSSLFTGPQLSEFAMPFPVVCSPWQRQIISCWREDSGRGQYHGSFVECEQLAWEYLILDLVASNIFLLRPEMSNQCYEANGTGCAVPLTHSHSCCGVLGGCRAAS